MKLVSIKNNCAKFTFFLNKVPQRRQRPGHTKNSCSIFPCRVINFWITFTTSRVNERRQSQKCHQKKSGKIQRRVWHLNRNISYSMALLSLDFVPWPTIKRPITFIWWLEPERLFGEDERTKTSNPTQCESRVWKHLKYQICPLQM